MAEAAAASAPAARREALRPRASKAGAHEGLRAALQLDSRLSSLRRRGDLYLLGVSALQAVVLLAVGHTYNALGLAAILSAGLPGAAVARFVLALFHPLRRRRKGSVSAVWWPHIQNNNV